MLLLCVQTQFFVCCNRILALIELMRGWRPTHGIWQVVVKSGPFNNQTKLTAMAEVVESKIKGKVQAHFSLDMRASGAATTDVMGGGVTTIDLTNSSVISAASNVVQMNQGITTGVTTVYPGDQPMKHGFATYEPQPLPPRTEVYNLQSPQSAAAPPLPPRYSQQPQSPYSSTTTSGPTATSDNGSDPYASYGNGPEGGYRR